MYMYQNFIDHLYAHAESNMSPHSMAHIFSRGLGVNYLKIEIEIE